MIPRNGVLEVTMVPRFLEPDALALEEIQSLQNSPAFSPILAWKVWVEVYFSPGQVLESLNCHSQTATGRSEQQSLEFHRRMKPLTRAPLLPYSPLLLLNYLDASLLSYSDVAVQLRKEVVAMLVNRGEEFQSDVILAC